MRTFRQFLEEAKKADQAYGWLNPKGSFIKNRNGDIHGDTYTKFTGDRGPRGGDYWDKIAKANKKGWQRLDIQKDASPRGKEIYGVIMGKKEKWTPRHNLAMRRIKKAMGVDKTYANNVEKAKG